MPLLSINLESKPKFLVTFGLVLMFFGFLYIFGVLFIFDLGSTRYIQTEFDLLKYRNIHSAVHDQLAQIQDLRLSIPIGLAQSAGTISMALAVTGGLCVCLGLFYHWGQRPRGDRAERVLPTVSSPTRTMLTDYFWVIGLSLLVVGASKLYDDPIGTLVAGVIFYAISIVLKAWNAPEGSSRSRT